MTDAQDDPTKARVCSLFSEDEIAERVGYETTAAFSKAFRRIYGTAPGRFRSNADKRGAPVVPLASLAG